MQKVINQWIQANGYLEKKDGSNLGDFTDKGKMANAGENNYTIMADWFKRDTGENYQGQPYCAMTMSEMFVAAYGLETAKKMLCGSLYSYCPDIYNAFKKQNRIYTKPQKGDVVLFSNGTRFHHVGFVVDVSSDGSKITTAEGNTSSGSQVIANGGAIRYGKTYQVANLPGVAFARPDWSLIPTDETKPVEVQPAGWILDGKTGKWWYRLDDKSYPKSDWYRAYCAYDKKYHWFLFDADGWMLTGRQTFNGKQYLLEDAGPSIGVCFISDDKGALRYMDA